MTLPGIGPMKLSSRKTRRDAVIELSMTSMIDVVFLLLIFFMTTSAFVLTERNLDTAIQVQDATADQQADLEPAIVDIVPGPQGYVYQLGTRQIPSQAELEAVLRQMPNKSAGAFVRVDDTVPFGMPAAAVQACRSAGFPAVSYVPK